MRKLGRHLIIEYYNCTSKVLNDTARIERYMNEAAKVAGATVIGSDFHTFNPWGVSGVVVIAESHLTIHTWPEYGYAAVDIFTCGDDVDPWAAHEYLTKVLGAQNSSVVELNRGIINQIQKYLPIEKLQNINVEETTDLTLKGEFNFI